MILKHGSYVYKRPEYSIISDTDFEKGKIACLGILIDMAKKKSKPINYKALASRLHINYPFDEDPEMRVLAHILGEIFIENVQKGEPLITALVIEKESAHCKRLGGSPGAGFYSIAKDLGFKFDDDIIFWGQEMKKVYNYKWA